MNINVTIDDVKITDDSIIHSGELNINECNFTFSNEYNNLIKRAIFSNLIGDWLVGIDNNRCYIPEEVLKLSGSVTLGVYAYEDNNGTLELRYSPAPTKFSVKTGSYKSASIPIEVSKDLIKQVEDIINEVQQKLDNGDFDGVGIEDITFNADYSMTITLTDNSKFTSQSLRGEQGIQGIQGETGNGISSIVLNNNYTLTINYTNGDSYTTKSIRGAEGYTPQKGIDYFTPNEIADITQQIENDIQQILNQMQQEIDNNKMELSESEVSTIINNYF